MDNPNPLLKVEKKNKKKGKALEHWASYGIKNAPLYLGGLGTTMQVSKQYDGYVKDYLKNPLICAQNQVETQGERKVVARNLAAPIISQATTKESPIGYGKGMGCRIPVSPVIPLAPKGEGTIAFAAQQNGAKVACNLAKNFYDVDAKTDRFELVHGHEKDTINNHECAEPQLAYLKFGKAQGRPNPHDTIVTNVWTQFGNMVPPLMVVFTTTCPIRDRNSCDG